MVFEDEDVGFDDDKRAVQFPFSMMAMCMNMAATMSAQAMHTAREGMSACAHMMGAQAGPRQDSEPKADPPA